MKGECDRSDYVGMLEGVKALARVSVPDFTAVEREKLGDCNMDIATECDSRRKVCCCSCGYVRVG